MKTPGIPEIKQELLSLPPKKVLELCLKLAKFKKENKELLSFLLFDAHDEQGYVEKVKSEIDEQFLTLPNNTWYQTKKSLRKILRLVAKFSKHVAAKESEADLLLHFCTRMNALREHYPYNLTFSNLYQLQIKKLGQIIEAIHEDIQGDYKRQMVQLEKSGT